MKSVFCCLFLVMPLVLVSDVSVRANNQFAEVLLDELFQELHPDKENLCVSPYTINNTCALAFIGASGDTKSQMQKLFGYSTQETAAFCKEMQRMQAALAPVIDSAHALCVAINFFPIKSYLDNAEKGLQAEVFEIDIAQEPEEVRQPLNAWIAKKTRGHIKDLIGTHDIPSTLRMMLLGASFCKGQWRSPFDAAMTREEPFHCADGVDRPVKMMQQRTHLPMVQDREAAVVLLECKPAGSEALRSLQGMIILLNEGVNVKLTADKIALWGEKAKGEFVQLLLPRFTIRQKLDLRDVLQKLGMSDAFSKKADFSLIEPETPLQIDKVLHEALLEVNEEGVTAAAATAVSMIVTSIGPSRDEPKVVRCDRPFFFVLREKQSGTILFMAYYATL